jgi:GT2 family glycosyltransferase
VAGSGPSTPRVSILSAIDHDTPDADEWFGALRRQTLGTDAEAIAVDPTWNDHYRDAYERLEPGRGQTAVSYERIPRSARAAALNRAAERSSGEILVFLACDISPRPDFAEAHLAFHELHTAPEHVGIGSALIPEELLQGRFTRWLERSGSLFGIPFDEPLDVPESFFYVGNASIKRELFERVGRFDEDFPHHSWEDFEIGLRMREAGMRSAYVEGAGASHMHPLGLRERCHTMRESGESLHVLERKHPGLRHPSMAVPRTAPAVWRIGAAVAACRFMVTRRDRFLHAYYRRRLRANLSAGYRGAVSREPDRATREPELRTSDAPARMS